MTASRAAPAKSRTIDDLSSTLELRVFTGAGPRRTWVSPSHVARTSQVALLQLVDVDVACRDAREPGWAAIAGGRAEVEVGVVLAGEDCLEEPPPHPIMLTAASAPRAARLGAARVLTRRS